VYVETDGRHVSAISFDGRVLWTRIPVVDVHLKPWPPGGTEPKISYIGGPWIAPPGNVRKGSFIDVRFDSLDFGILNLKSGEFTHLGE
jgi:hypothetical protein